LNLEDTSSESIIDDIFEAWTEFKEEEQKIKEIEERLKQEEEKGKIIYIYNYHYHLI
jgi:hypothetical protein